VSTASGKAFLCRSVIQADGEANHQSVEIHKRQSKAATNNAVYNFSQIEWTVPTAHIM
jgi:hypothetical protein